MSIGVLLVNLGTPNSSSRADVKAYLHQFLTDKRVIDLAWPLRYALVYGLIVPFRAQKSAQAYQKIWSDKGSPLLFHSQELAIQLQKKYQQEYIIALGMRYGSPSLKTALEQLKECTQIIVLPLYPQYSSAATGSAIEEILGLVAKQDIIPSVHVISEFYQHPAYINAQAQVIKQHYKKDHHLLFSYHGIPERQIYKSGCKTLCQEACPPIFLHNQNCYRAQCYQTSLLLAAELGLEPTQYSIAFQSRLGKIPWIQPYTQQHLIDLAAQGITDLTVVCPSFVADCLETIEEIGMQAQKQWQQLGGTSFNLIPSLNAEPIWLEALAHIIKTASK